MTANALCSLSLDPLLALVCFENEARTLPIVREAGRFGVNVLSRGPGGARGRVRVEAARGREARWRRSPVRAGVPIIEGAMAWAACELRELIAGGDHTIAIGEVLSLGSGEGEPLLWYGGRYHAWPGAPRCMVPLAALARLTAAAAAAPRPRTRRSSSRSAPLDDRDHDLAAARPPAAALPPADSRPRWSSTSARRPRAGSRLSAIPAAAPRCRGGEGPSAWARSTSRSPFSAACSTTVAWAVLSSRQYRARARPPPAPGAVHAAIASSAMRGFRRERQVLHGSIAAAGGWQAP